MPSPARQRLIALPAGPAAADTATRIGGEDRIETSVAISQASFPTAGSAKAVVLARADDFADALAGTPFAVHEGGPLLVTGPAKLDIRVSQEIRRVLAPDGQVFVLGGAKAVSPVVVDDLVGIGLNPVRIEGTDRFDTALQIAARFGAPLRVLLCSGLSFPDALSAGAAAAASRGLVLLTNGAFLPPAVAQYLADHPGAEYFAVGGPAAQAAPTAMPIVGVDRFDTAVQVAARLFNAPVMVGARESASLPRRAVRRGDDGQARRPVALVPAAVGVPPVVLNYLQANAGSITTVNVFGGGARSPTSSCAELNDAYSINR